jgi:flagellar basal-body rod protein FlgF
MAAIAPQVSAKSQSLIQDFEIIAHNMANVSTPGYKRRVNGFAAQLEAQMGQAMGTPTAEIVVHKGIDFSPGPLEQTGRALDFAISGKGFFVIETPDGLKYTRNGGFTTNELGELVPTQAKEGEVVAGKDVSPIVIPPEASLQDLHVSSTGVISYHDGESLVPLGALRIEEFAEFEDQLQSVGESYFVAPSGLSGTTMDDAVVAHKTREASNVKMMEELVGMITVSRLYEANMKFLAARKDLGASLMNVAMG